MNSLRRGPGFLPSSQCAALICGAQRTLGCHPRALTPHTHHIRVGHTCPPPTHMYTYTTHTCTCKQIHMHCSLPLHTRVLAVGQDARVSSSPSGSPGLQPTYSAHPREPVAATSLAGPPGSSALSRGLTTPGPGAWLPSAHLRLGAGDTEAGLGTRGPSEGAVHVLSRPGSGVGPVGAVGVRLGSAPSPHPASGRGWGAVSRADDCLEQTLFPHSCTRPPDPPLQCQVNQTPAGGESSKLNRNERKPR